MCDYAQAFDAGSLIPAEAGRVVSLCAAIEGSVATLKALAAARLADGGSWRSEGYRSAEEQLADRTGVGTGQARRQLQNGRRLAEHPEVAQAALSGELSAEQAELVAVGAEADASKAGDLIDKAKRGSIGELRDEVTQVRADHIDREEQRRRIHASRRLLKFVDLEGVWHLMASGNVEDGMTVDSLLTPIRQRLNRLRRDRGQDLQTFGQLDHDALIALAEIACGREGELSLADLVDLGFFAQLRDLGGATLAVPPTATEDGSGSGYGRALGVGAGAAAGTGASVALAPPIPPRPGPSASGSGDSTALSRQLPSGVPSGPGSRFDELGSPPAAQPGATEPVGLSPAAQPGATEPVGLSPVGRGEASRPAVAGPEPPPKRRPPRLAGRPINLMIRVDLDTLLRGVPIQGELCEIPGYGPIPVSLIQDLAANGSVFVSAVLAKSRKVVGVYRHRRRPDIYRQTALDFIYPGCAVKGCNRKAGLEYEHRIDWQHTHYTVYDLMDRLCWFHHQQKTNHGWMLIEGTGKRAFVAPDDPRHPRHHSHQMDRSDYVGDRSAVPP